MVIKYYPGKRGADAFYYVNEAAALVSVEQLLRESDLKTAAKAKKVINAHRLYSAQFGLIANRIAQSKEEAKAAENDEERAEILLDGKNLESYLRNTFAPEFRKDIRDAGFTLVEAFEEILNQSGPKSSINGPNGLLEFLRQNLLFGSVEDVTMDSIHTQIQDLFKRDVAQAIEQLVLWSKEHGLKDGKVLKKSVE